VNLRAKLLILFVAGSLVPLLLVALLFYLNGRNVVEGMLREQVEREAASVAHNLEAALREREVDLSELAQSPALGDYARGLATADDAPGDASPATKQPAAPVPKSVGASITNFISHNRDYYAAVTLVGALQPGHTLIRVEPPDAGSSSPRVSTGDLLPGQLSLDGRIWTTSDAKPLRSNVTRGANGTPRIVYTVPLLSPGNEQRPRFALVAELKLEPLLQEAVRASHAAVPPANAPLPAGSTAQSAHLLVVLDRTGQIVHHTNHGLIYQPANAAMSYFDAFARAMQAGRSGTDFYTDPADRMRWLASYRPVAGTDLSVASAGNYTRAVASLNRNGLTTLALALSIAGAAAIFVYAVATRAARRIKRVTEAAAAIGAGDLNQRIEVHANDETHALAEGFNRMSDRLRELIAREAEMRQFQSFVRLSAMLTHDLKNAITGLSMLVTNMERQFHRAEFRVDAVSSLRQATEKLGGLVARLSEPVKSLSGEYRRTPQSSDLIPVIRRALAATAEPRAEFYDIRTELPETLVAPIDAERIERVLENLIVNAFEAMGGRGGRLTVAAGEESAELVYFSVEDTGPGMTEDFMRTRLFRAFATTKKRGIGLGLYTCREIVESHGGRLEVKSKLGSGTRFRVVLPSVPLMASHARAVEKSTLAKTITGTGAAG
jgi:signal transduction histidine kinase